MCSTGLSTLTLRWPLEYHCSLVTCQVVLMETSVGLGCVCVCHHRRSPQLIEYTSMYTVCSSLHKTQILLIDVFLFFCQNMKFVWHKSCSHCIGRVHCHQLLRTANFEINNSVHLPSWPVSPHLFRLSMCQWLTYCELDHEVQTHVYYLKYDASECIVLLVIHCSDTNGIFSAPKSLLCVFVSLSLSLLLFLSVNMKCCWAVCSCCEQTVHRVS